MPILGQSSSSDHSIVIETNFDIDNWADQLGPALTKKFLNEACKYVLAELERRFKTGEGPDGRKWKKLHPATVNRKKKSRAILRNTDKLMKSFKGIVYEDELVVGTSIPYSVVHQYGAVLRLTKKQSVWMYHNLFYNAVSGSPFMFTKVVIPSRPFIGWGRKDKDFLLNKLKSLVKATETLGGKNV